MSGTRVKDHVFEQKMPPAPLSLRKSQGFRSSALGAETKHIFLIPSEESVIEAGSSVSGKRTKQQDPGHTGRITNLGAGAEKEKSAFPPLTLAAQII